MEAQPSAFNSLLGALGAAFSSGVIERCTEYRARCGRNPYFPTPEEAADYDAGFNAFPHDGPRTKAGKAGWIDADCLAARRHDDLVARLEAERESRQ